MNFTGRKMSVQKPLRDIVLNHEELLKHSLEIANLHVQIGTDGRKRSLLPRVTENMSFLETAYQEITGYMQRTKDMVPAAEWFLDNYYLLKDLKLEIRRNLPRKYARQLPRLANGEFQGYPRIYALMVELIEHTDSQLNSTVLMEFINSYQSLIPLSSGELWSVPIMLRIALLENIRQLIQEILETQKEREAAEKWVQPFLSVEPSQEKFADLLKKAESPLVYSTAYVERLARHIRDLGTEGIPILRWIDQEVAKQDTTVENLAKLEYQRQAMCQVSLGHAITSIRYLAAQDWPHFFEEVSLIEKILEADPSGVFPNMDFDSRDAYRHKVEELARQHGVSELTVARKVLERAEGEKITGLPGSHVGFWLIGPGYQKLTSDLETKSGLQGSLLNKLEYLISKNPRRFYFGSLLLVSILLIFGFLSYGAGLKNMGQGREILLILLLLIPISNLAISLVNWLMTQIVRPAFLPKLELRDGIPAELRTIVVIPTLLPSVSRVKELLNQIEVYFLANQDSHLHFALLGDFVDAKVMEMPEDKEIIQAAVDGIQLLNQKYGVERFFFFHRKRQWNPCEGVWMGWERKRGKLIEFNRLICEGGETSYDVQIGELSLLSEMHYVITLDADTCLPRDSAKKLVGTIAHPLQTPILDKEGHRVIDGYGILQPRIGISVESASATFFSRLFSGRVGIDPYTRAISDTYQDLFGEGIFTGKGIYNIQVFHQVTGSAFPENTILSHDLLEGLYCRTGLVTDVEFIDGFPSKYYSYIKRLHRWVRGDWQIAPWLFKPLPLVSRWKIFDNLRRSLEAPVQLLLIILGFLVFPGQPWLWAGLVILNFIFPVILVLLDLIFNFKPVRGEYKQELSEGLLKAFLTFVFLPYKALIMLDAIGRSLIRQTMTHRHLLEWETAADTEKRLKVTVKSSWSIMFPALIIVLLLNALVLVMAPMKFWQLSPLSILWFLSPWLAYKISIPADKSFTNLSEREMFELRRWARRIWAFFEEFVNEDEHWLPPDNIQIEPPNGVAHRTSPTNIGLAILANFVARDFGYLSLTKLCTRIENTLQTVESLEHWRGHLFNWYDTVSLQPLEPLYVSTVDSGNFALYLLVAEEGLREMLDKPLIEDTWILGLKDTFELLLANLQEQQNNDFGSFASALKEASITGERSSLDISAYYGLLQKWPQTIPELPEEALFWAHSLQDMVLSFREEIENFYPWLRTGEELGKDTDSPASQLLLELSEKKLSIKELSIKYKNFLDKIQDSGDSGLDFLYPLLSDASKKINNVIDRSENLQQRLNKISMETDFKPLFEETRQLFSIGYRVNEGVLDKSYYDLLASEARQASFLAIAKGEIPSSHWFRLGRSLTRVRGRRTLVSWSGTMFEFFMPLLVMRNYPGTLLDETYRSVIEIQKSYGIMHGVPWGISESGFYAFDAQLNYQYKAFGVPGLGLKRGLIQDLVIAPYATFLALQKSPLEALQNIRMMSEQGFAGRYGLYEAVDYTPERIPVNKKSRVIQSFMAHHQGMSFLALDNTVNHNPLPERLHSNALIKSAELLLQERMPLNPGMTPQPEAQIRESDKKIPEELSGDWFITLNSANSTIPITHFVANGEYSLMLTNAGSGYSKLGDLAISRWREDVTCDSWGMYFYIQNLNSGDFWSVAHQPCGFSGENYKVTYAPDRIEFYRKDGNLGTRTEIAVSPEEHVEVRRISLTNYGQHTRELEITSYFEIVLARPNEDLAHPAFGNLFIQTEFVNQSLLAHRRLRREEQTPYWLMQTTAVDGESLGSIQYETDRARFIGRGRNLRNPQALDPNHPLSNTVGAVLDPIFSLRQRVRVRPGQTVRVAYSTGIASTREDVIRLAEKYRSPAAVNRAFELAWTHSQMELHNLNLLPAQANLALNIAGHILYLSPEREKVADVIKRNQKGQSALWAYSISGDLPIVIIRVKENSHLEFVRRILAVHEYWRLKGLHVDLVILNEDESGYVQAFQDNLRDLVSMGYARDLLNRPGGIFLLQKNIVKPEDLDLLYSVARLVFAGDEGSCYVQMRKKGKVLPFNPRGEILFTGQRNESDSAIRSLEKSELFPSDFTAKELQFFNGWGGFEFGSSEYVIMCNDSSYTPLPWINVIANKNFGFQVSETGAGYTWSGNSRENKLTPWSNDPILDPPREALYIRDEKSGEYWSPTLSPCRGKGKYIIRHGQGYSIFEHTENGVQEELTLFVPLDAPLKIIQLKLLNQTEEARQLSIIYYAEWVMGVARELSAPYIVTEYDERHHAVLAHNSYQEEFAGRVAFLGASGGEITSFTGERLQFIGRNGNLEDPLALRQEALSNVVGGGMDPCAALQMALKLKPGEEKKICFLLGESTGKEEYVSLLEEYSDLSHVEKELLKVKSFWRDILGTVQVHTPEKAMDIMVNNWLLYQSVVCRLWARSAFYQSGGAYGFRDQLQDVMAMVYTAPEWTREQIILHCSHQFVEGDVQHWWHAEQNKGIRTKFSDDLLWLPYVTAEYLEKTNDIALLDETIPFIEDEPLGEGQDERYSTPRLSSETASVYEHCIRALERGLRFGKHGIPLIGSGDWNDGFSEVGRLGRGESVWLGWFLYVTLQRFARICEQRTDFDHAERYKKIAAEMKENLERNGWDGGWYRRAFFDDGTPLGSSQNEECQIDAIAQSWSVISGAAKESRYKDAMLALEHYLWRKDDGILLLLTPPFDHSQPNPGYIKGYVPGVRENGGQYTHGAIWAILAFAKMGEGNKAFELFNMLNPINHARTKNEVARYKAEPYVMAADVYAIGPHVGRGGWTWYTGAAGWMYKAGLEGILGFNLQGERLQITPCIPNHWAGYSIDYRFKSTLYNIKVENPQRKNMGTEKIYVDGKLSQKDYFDLTDDGREHEVKVIM